MSHSSVRDVRHVALARTLHKRLYISATGRILIASGAVSYSTLVEALKRCERIPGAANSPSPTELGVSGSDGEFSPALLHDIGRALNRWKIELGQELSRRPAGRRKAEELIREQREVARLETKLADLRRVCTCVQRREAIGSAYFLDSVDEDLLKSILAAHHGVGPDLAHIGWQARIVYWLSGQRATERFFDALRRLFADHVVESPYEPLRRFGEIVATLKLRIGKESLRQLVSELKKHLQKLSPEIVKAGRFSSRHSGKPFSEHCDLLIAGCAELMQMENLGHHHHAPATVAAVAASDGCAIAIPLRDFDGSSRKSSFSRKFRTLQALAEQIGKPGYSLLLASIEKLPKAPAAYELDLLRQSLAKGNRLDDVLWAVDQGLMELLFRSHLKISGFRRLFSRFDQCGVPLTSSETYRLVQELGHKPQLAPIVAWLDWVGSVGAAALRPRLLHTLRISFWDRFLPSIRQAGWFEQFSDVLAAIRRTKNRCDAASLLARISVYQKVVGRKNAIPKSLRDILERRPRFQLELAHLHNLRASGALTESARLRLAWLETEAHRDEKTCKLRRAAEEAFILLGIEAQHAIADRLAETKCREHLGELTALMPRELIVNLALWIDKMSRVERARLRELIEAYDVYGAAYKRYLEPNGAWIAKAEAKGVDLEAWFSGETTRETIDGRTFEIGLETDLCHLFRMGDYFKTCLSIGGVNQLSVLTNATDANKQVVFMFTVDDAGERQVVARQLIAISEDFRLLGYYPYMSWRHAEKQKRQEGLDALARFCGALAARCGVELADQGTPERIGDHFWYDDGEHEWSAAARAASQGRHDESSLVTC